MDCLHLRRSPLRRGLLALIVIAAWSSAAAAPAQAAVSFSKKTLALETSSRPTSLQWGPDGRLYVASQSGVIKAYTVARSSTGSYSVTATETISLINAMPNRNDNGALNSAVTGRLVTGIVVTGTASSPVIYAGSSDPRIGAGPDGSDLNLDTNSGIISKLTKGTSGWTKQDLVRGLPRSEENHTANGLALSADGQTLYVAQGGNTNKGAPSNNFANLPEYALSAAILSVNLSALPLNAPYDLPTLDDDSRTGTPDVNDPFGGNDGKNQAKLVPGGPVQVYAPGFRNPYDVLVTSGGKMYSIDNGGNSGWGDVPVGEGPGGTCTNAINEPGTTARDSLHAITGPGYYGGHPNPTRANTANTFNSTPQSPVSTGSAVQCDFRSPGDATGAGKENGALVTFGQSTNGLAEYTASNFGNEMKGNLVAASYDNTIQRLIQTSATTASKSALASAVGANPLDVTTVGDTGVFPGTIWVADVGTEAIYVLEPSDYSGSAPPSCNPSSTDSDGDGYSNDDEAANGTDPCSAADKPADFDADKVSDLTDANDDNDALADKVDPFARDSTNGLNRTLPVSYLWENESSDELGGFFGLGFTGLMTNGTTDYLAQFDADGMTTGGAAGVVTVDEVDPGDAYTTANSQRYGFQFGVKARPTDGPFTVRTRIVGPFKGVTPQNYQSMGLFLGTGDQDNYVKITTAMVNSTMVQTVREVAGAQVSSNAALALPGPDYVDLYLRVDPAAAKVQPSFTATSNGVTTARANVGPSVTVPSSWFTAADRGLAVGIISTSTGPGPAFPATWDFMEVTPDAAAPADPGLWASLTATGLSRQEVSFVQVAGKLYLAGGGTAHQVYDPATKQWSSVAALPQRLDHIQGVEVGGRIYYIGGLAGWPTPEVGTVMIYDPATNTFSNGAAMPRPRGAGGIAVANGKIYYAGGLSGGSAVNWLDEYDPATNTWRQLPNMPTARDHFHAVVSNGKLWAIGGRNSTIAATTKVNEAFTFSTGTWSTGHAPLPTARGGFAAAAHGDEILVIGGEDASKAHATVEAYNVKTNTWRAYKPMPTARHGIQAATCNGGIYIAAGGTTPGGSNPTGAFEVLYPGGSATTCTAPAGDTTAPTVSSVSPAAGATSVAVGTNVTAVFSEAMTASTISGSTVKLTAPGSTTPVAATVSYDATSKQATLNPSSDLAAGVTYTATVVGGSSGVKDLAGNALAQSKTWTFTTASATQPPPTGAVAADTFARTITGGWGSADTGGAWTLSTASAYSVASGVGSVAVPGGSVQRLAYLGSTSVRDVDIKVDTTFGTISSGSHLQYVLARRQSTGTYLRLGLVAGGGKLLIRGQTSAGSNLFADTDTGLGFAAGTSYSLRVQLSGASPTTIRMRAWKTGTTEPTTWKVQTTSSSGPQTAGAIGLRQLNTGSTATTIKTDNLAAATLAP